MMDTSTLNQKFSLGGELFFENDGNGLVLAHIDNRLASARLCLQGAHLLTWHPRTTPFPVVWLSEAATPMLCKSPHSGVPVCWPWFGAHPEGGGRPDHGFARNVLWSVVETGSGPDGATHLALRLLQNEWTRAFWPHDSELELRVEVGERLRMALTTRNTGGADFTISEALHTYFQISDIAGIGIHGLDGCDYLDKTAGFARLRQNGAIRFEGETDRVYLDAAAECVIEDPGLRRRIVVAKQGGRSTVVWTPWREKAAKLADLAPNDGWRHMVCVESANAMDNRVTVPAGATHTLAVEYRVEALEQPRSNPLHEDLGASLVVV